MDERNIESGTLCSTDGHKKIAVCLLVVYGLQSQLEMKEKKKEELYNACLRTVLMMERASYLDDRRLPEGPSRGIETPRDGKDATLVVRCCRAFHARSPRDTTYDDGKHQSRLGYAFANTAALRAVRRFEVSQERAVPKYKLLAGGRNRFGNDFASGTERGNTFEESDAYKDAFLKPQNEKSTETKTAGKGREPRLVQEPVCQKAGATVHGRSRCAGRGRNW